MALPQELTVDDELAAFEESNEELQEPSALLGAYREWALAMAKLAADLEELERRLTRMKNKGTAVLSVVRNATPASIRAINFDELVKHYEELEEKMRGYALPIIERAKAKKKEQFSLPVSRAERSNAIAIYNKIIRIHVQALGINPRSPLAAYGIACNVRASVRLTRFQRFTRAKISP